MSFNLPRSSWFAQFIWKPFPAFSVNARRMTNARSCRWTLPYLSFFLIALAASYLVSLLSKAIRLAARSHNRLAHRCALVSLDVDSLYELWDAVEGELIVSIRGEHLDPIGDRRMRLALFESVDKRQTFLEVGSGVRHSGCVSLLAVIGVFDMGSG
jgi:hypothetical protein